MKRRLLHLGKLLPLAILFIILAAPEWPAFAADEYRIEATVNLRQFDFLIWETNAFLAKAQALLADDQAFLDEQSRQQVVLDFLAQVQEARLLQSEIEATFVNPDIADPERAAEALQNELDQVRAELEAVQPLAEAIVQEQVAWALRQEGFTILGQAWPPVLMHMTPLPSLLVISPRDRVENIYQVPLQHGLTTPTFAEMETAVYDDLDLSALVVPIGGLGTYPAMILETTSISRLVEVTAHEWVHHWLTLQPLGIRYAQDAQMRVINETVASMVDVELRDRVLARFYPELVERAPAAAAKVASASEAPAFDFRAEMAQTRIRVDELLAEGAIAAAESYMDERRALFVDNGYAIRRLNQAYFAFYGAYAAQPGATGGDPIGPLLRALRADSPSLRIFLDTVAQIKTFADLEQIASRISTED